MKEIKRRLVLDDFEYRLLVGCVNKARTMFIDEDKPVDDVSALLLKIIDGDDVLFGQVNDFEQGFFISQLLILDFFHLLILRKLVI
ncbi:MAG: hypothetical protein MJ091_05335, partial [Clostridia bacterium]|nr:hypothetical protein [Clostridia bacterium]